MNRKATLERLDKEFILLYTSHVSLSLNKFYFLCLPLSKQVESNISLKQVQP